MAYKIAKIFLFLEIIIASVQICIILLLLEFAGDRHGETEYEDFLFFPAFFGFISCIIIFRIGVALRAVFMRDEDYYDK